MSKQPRFEKLLETGNIGTVKIRNRIIKSAGGLNYWGRDGNLVNEKVKSLHEAYARGGVGLIIIETQGAKGLDDKDNDKSIKQLTELTQLIHKYNCPVFIQLTSTVNWKIFKYKNDPNIPRGPSPVFVYSEMDNHNGMPRELTIAEIQEIADQFVRSAVAARKAGFDGIELNSSCSHLLHSFLSPFWNKRQDQYGCHSFENRTRLIEGIIRGIKKSAGQDFPVSTLINGIEIGKYIHVDDSECLNLEDSKKIAKMLQNAGADSVQVRSHWIGRHDTSFLTDHLYYPEPIIPLQSFPKELDMSRRGAGSNVLLAEAVKREVSIPVITVGRLDPELGESIVREGKADFIAMTRRLFADPELPNKIASGRYNDIVPCASCTACKDEDGPRRCRINASLGSERSYVLEPAARKKMVVVVGGGPAGMEAARVAAVRGHKVILYEKTHKLGGLIPLAAMVKGTDIEDLPAMVEYLKDQITKNGVDIRMGKELTSSIVDRIKPDVVIVATGGIPATPEIPGINNHIVMNVSDLHRRLKSLMKFIGPNTLRWLTKFWMPIGKNVVIIGGDIQGCELAEFLVKRGRKVTIVDSADELGEGMIRHLKLQLFWWFREKGVIMMPGVKPVAITNKGLTVFMKEGYKSTIAADSIIPVVPMKLDIEMMKSLQGKVGELYAVGDCNNPRLIVDAIADGWKIASSI
jgi:2,4-dienoyl-CoA reductase (NADPH2)